MDYRHTEAFAREMEAAALRAHALREQALDAFFAALVRAVRQAWRALALPHAAGQKCETPGP